MSRVQIMRTYVLIITTIIKYFKVACTTTAITPSLKLKVIPTRSVASQNWQKTFAEYPKSRMEHFHATRESVKKSSKT